VRTPFDAPLGPEWNHLRNPVRESYSVQARPGWLTLHGTATTLAEAASPTWVGRRQQHFSCRVATLLDFAPLREGDEAGLSVYMSPDHRYEIGVRRVGPQAQVFVRQRVGRHLEAVTASSAVEANAKVVLQVDAAPEEYRFSFGAVGPDGRAPASLAPLGTAATRYLSSEVAGGFTGVYLGLYAAGSGASAGAPAHFDWFDYEPREESGRAK
jgi:alpha-N-arabinofuranosidase